MSFAFAALLLFVEMFCEPSFLVPAEDVFLIHFY